MLKRLDFAKRMFAAVTLVVALCACQETKANDQSLITGGGNVNVLQTSYIATGDSSSSLSGGGLTYIVNKIEFTNDTNSTLAPIIEHFFLQDQNGQRYSGVDSGSYVLAGVSNDLGQLKPGEKRTLTVAFRALPSTAGKILYAY